MTTDEVKDYLFGKFPGFVRVWNSDENCHKSDDGGYTYHGLFSEFSDYFAHCFADVTSEQLRSLFGDIEKLTVEEGGDLGSDQSKLLSNAVSTCFLENIAGRGFTARLEPFMGEKSWERYSFWDYPGEVDDSVAGDL